MHDLETGRHARAGVGPQALLLGLASLPLLALVLLVVLGGEESAAGTVLTGPAAVGAAVSVVLLALVLLWAALGPGGASWCYAEPGRRDLRVDLLRGLAVVFVVLNHLRVESLYHLVSQELIGPVSGAELFVALSGVVLGLVHRPRFEQSHFLDASPPLLRRAWKLYRTAIVVVVGTYLLSLLPAVDGRELTTFTDEGTGAAGAQAAGQTYDLYPSIEGWAEYPVPAWVVRSLLLLQEGPWQFDVMGLYVVLLLVAPVLLWLLGRGLWPVVLLASVTLYAVNLVARTRPLPSQFEDSFPLLSWQLLFVGGLVVGWHRQEVFAALRRTWGRPLVALLVALHVGALLFSWSNPYLSNEHDVRLALLSPATFDALYRGAFERTFLEPGRLVSVVLVLVTLYGLLTAFWRPLNAAVGWFLVPLGQATLYVFIMHVFFALAVSNVPGVRDDVLAGTAAHTVVLALLWVMVKRRFLFRFVPR